jgi:PPOX class probable F420-dependent enzyme
MADMGYRTMDDEAVRRFLTEPVRPAVLATVRADGRSHAVPVWYDLDDDGTLVFNTGATTVKGRNLARTGRATLVVQDPEPPFSFVTVEGPVTLVDDLDQVRAWAGRIGGRYMGADRADEYGTRNGVPGELLVRLTPEHVTSAFDVSD